jgi:ankyrin repeat protein
MNVRTLLTACIALALLSASFAQTDDPRSARRERSRDRGNSTRRGPVNPALEEFFTAAGAGDVEKIKILLAADPSLATADNRQKETALHHANTGEAAVALLDAGAAIDVRDWLGVTPLHEASSENRIDVVRVLLEHGATLEIPAEKSGTTPLAVASAIGYKDVVELLIAKGANVNARDLGDETPLMAASIHPEVAEILLAHGAELDATDRDGRTALDHAVEEKRQPGIDFLKSRGAIGKNTARDMVAAAEKGDLETVRRDLGSYPRLLNSTDHGSTMLGMAAFEGRAAVVEFLLQQKADLEMKNSGEQTALHMAADGQHPEVIKLLLAAGASTKARDNNGETPALAAANEDDPSGFELLFAADPDLTVRTRREQTLLHRAALSHSSNAVRLLLERGHEVDPRDNEGYTPLALAFDSGSRENIALLLEHKADVNVMLQGNTMLHLILKSGEAELEGVALLIAAGADVNAPDSDGGTPLHYAVALGDISIAEALVAAGAGVNTPAAEAKVTPLHIAIDKEQTAMIGWLLDHGADIEAKLAGGDTPLLHAANLGIVETGLMLLERGANPLAAFPNGDTLLHFAPLPLVEAALARGAGIEARRVDGVTPLCMQAFNANLDVVKFLIAHGAQIDARDNNGRPVLDYANFARTDASGKSLETEDSIARKREIYKLLKPAGMALFEAAMAGDLAAALAALAKDPAAVAWTDSNDQATALLVAANRGHREIVDALLQARADVNVRDRSGYTALHYLMVDPVSGESRKKPTEDTGAWLDRSRALRERKFAIGGLLISAGADINVQNSSGATPLDAAMDGSEYPLAELLRSKNAKGRISSGEAFQAVGTVMSTDPLKKLLAKDRKLVRLKDEQGRTLLVYAGEFSYLDAIKVLLESGADINAANSKGETALHFAARKGDETIASFLVANKAVVNGRTTEGATPLDYANFTRTDADGKSIENERTLASKQRIAELLTKRGAKAGG